MDDDIRLGRELLQQNGLGNPGAYVEQWREIEKLLKRDQRRGRLLMWCCLGLLTAGVVSILVTLTSWLWMDYPGSTYFLATRGWLDIPYSRPIAPVSFTHELVRQGLPIFGGWCLCLSLAFAVAWFFYSRGADHKALAARLRNIEMLLRKGPNTGAVGDRD
jgi:hypothetical protein